MRTGSLTGRTLAVLFIACTLAAGCTTQMVKNEGQAMAPTFNDGDSALVSRRIETIERGDIIAFRYPKDESKNFLKRIVALPGDRIESIDGRIRVNGAPLEEPYVADGNRSADSWGPVVVEADQYFVMGDNRRNSSDSRHWGPVRRDAVWGKVI